MFIMVIIVYGSYYTGNNYFGAYVLDFKKYPAVFLSLLLLCYTPSLQNGILKKGRKELGVWLPVRE